MTALVIGVGQPDRGDDAAGPAVAARVRELSPEIEIVTVTSPVRLLDVWEGHDEVVVVDAVRSGQRPGTVTTLVVADGPPLPARPGAGGSHGFGIAEAIELARSLERLPRRLVVVGIEAATFAAGASVTPQVAAALDEAAQAVLRTLTAASDRGGDP